MAKDYNTTISMKQGGDYFQFWSTTLSKEMTLSGEEMFWLARAYKRNITTSVLLLSTTSTTLSSLNIGSAAKWLVVSMTSNATSLSAWLTSSPYAGDELWIMLRTNSCASGTLLVSCSGVSLINNRGSDHSRFTIYNSAGSSGYAHLYCRTDGEWAVIEIGPTTASVTFT